VSFQAPLFLLALAVVPLALLAYRQFRRRARRYAVRFPGVPTLAAVLGSVPRWRRYVPLALYLLALAALATALARPEHTVAVAAEQAAVVLVNDTSRSMLATDVEPNRMEAARSASKDFLERVPGDLRIGAVAYAESPHTLERPTTDHEQIRSLIEGLSADGGTGTGEALMAGLRMFGERDEGQRSPAAMVLLSDGKTTTGRDPVEVARVARRQDVPIYTVALGSSTAVVPGPGGGVLPVPPDPETLRQIARASGGRAFTADDADELDTVYERLGSAVGTKDEKRQLTAGFAAGGIVLLLAAAATSLLRVGRLP
jgi:Ca-activated chloride channel family protein